LDDGTTFGPYSINPFYVTVTPTATTTYHLASLTDVGTGCHARAQDLTGRGTVTVNDVRVALKIYLQGPWNGTNMNNYLVAPVVYLPTTSPYNVNPYFVTATSTVPNYTSSPGLNIVDWVLVGLRTSQPMATFGWRAGLLMQNGWIKDMDGTSNLAMPAAFAGQSYWVVVVHRNHLGVLSNGSQYFQGCTTTFDFTTAMSQAYSPNSTLYPPMKQFGSVYALWAADPTGYNGTYPSGSFTAIGDGGVNATDWQYWYTKNGLLGYFTSDMNLDSSTDSYDTNTYWAPNNGKMSQALRGFPLVY
jgi:hypothetical protein